MENIFSKSKKTSPQTKRGFTLIEILVVFSVMMVIAAMVLPDYFAYQENIDLNNITHEIALAIREAQVYGFGAKVAPNTNSFDFAYGIEFDADNPTLFKLFVDKNSNGYLDTPNICDGTQECISIYALKDGFTISDFCVREIVDNSLLKCRNNPADLPSMKWLDIVYVRPGPEALITVYNNSRGILNNTNHNNQLYTRIVIKSQSGREKIISSSITGRIFIEQ